MKSACDLVNELHASYCARTGADLELNMARERTWGEWLAWRKVRFTPEDLARVIGWLKGKIRDGWDTRCIAFRNLIGDPEKFEEYLSEAKGAIKPASPLGPPRTYKEHAVPPPMTKEETDALLREHGFRPKS